jgi:hypothetical protein
MNAKRFSWVVGVSTFVFVMFFAFVLLWFAQYELVEGRIVDAGYTVSASETFVSDNGAHGTVVLPGEYYLTIEINGQVSNYTVDFETYLNALSGQTTVKLLCNPFSCNVIN